ncbi:MAG: hypothetical protein GY842_07905 [bacterium]|nr:hypothetical protein [bacterium]
MDAHQITQFLDQIERLWVSQVPPEYQIPALPVAVGALVAGIVLSVLGAKLARFGIACAFGVLGIMAGVLLAPGVNLPEAVIVVLGALVVGGLGYGLFRLWVGISAAAFFGVVAVSIYGSQAVVPHFVEYDPAYRLDSTCIVSETIVTDTGGCDRFDTVLSDLRMWADDFWLYVQHRETDVNRKVLGIGLGAGLLGLLLGTIIPRLTLIVVSSVVGTVLVMSGLAGLAAEFHLDLSRAGMEHGRFAAAAGITFLLASLLLQTLLTRQPPAAPRPEPQ